MAILIDDFAKAVPRIETERLILRSFRNEDFEAWAEMAADPEFNRYLLGEPLDRAQAWRAMATMVGHWVLRGYGFFAVEERATGNFIGRAGPWYPETWPAPEVGWAIAPKAQGAGYATEAARATLGWVFEELGWQRAIHVIRQGNRASIRVAEKLGSRCTGESIDVMGLGLSHVYVLTRDDFASCAGAEP